MKTWSTKTKTVLATFGLVVLFNLNMHPVQAQAPQPQPVRVAIELSSPVRSEYFHTSRQNWYWPINAPHQVTVAFITPEHEYGPGHRGIDIAAQPGDPVFASAAGAISFSGSVAGRSILSINHNSGVISSTEPVTSKLQAGEKVLAGQNIGLVSIGGHCAANCVHFGIRVNGEYRNPMFYLLGAHRARLLPYS